MRIRSISLVFLGGVLSLGSGTLFAQVPGGAPMQQPGQQPGLNQPTMPNPNMENSGPGSDPVQQMRDKAFVRQAAEGGMAEVQLGQLAAQKASSEDVKQFGQRMVNDHSQLNNEMKPVAEQMGVAVPKKLNKKDRAEYNKLSALSGSAFDQAYITAMVKDHHKDLKDFRTEASSTQNPQLRSTVEKGAQVIYQHTQLVDQLAQQKGIKVEENGKDLAETTPKPVQ